MRFSMITLGGLLLAAATPAMAQDEAEPAPAVTVTGSTTVTTDYRFRGITQTREDFALQATINVNHESGLYAGTWISTLDDTVSLPGYGNVEIDLYGGFTKTTDSGVGFDVGVLYYLYGDAVSGLDTDFFEPYASIMYSVGPANLKVGANYSFGGQDGLAGNDSLYLRGDATVGIPGSPVSVVGHVGYTDGQLGVLDPDGKYWDWSLGLAATHEFVTVSVNYIDTDITGDTVGGTPNYASAIGADDTIVGSLTLAF